MLTKRSKFERTKPHCNIGTIGHVDHGKTTLTAAITKCLSGVGNTVFRSYAQIDNHVEEQRRGITINVAHVEYETVQRHYSHIDCPGHQQYIKNMLTGAVQMEGAILVVAINDGPQVQTREHIILSKEVGIPYMIVYINKLDSLYDPSMKDLVELEIRELVESYGFDGDLPVIKGSARIALEEDKPSDIGTGSVLKLMSYVDSYIKQPQRLVDSPVLLPVENVYVIRGRGTVVTGKLEQGTLKVGEELEFIGKHVFPTICMGLEMFRKTLDFAEVGDSVGVLLKAIKKEDAKRGHVLCSVGHIRAYSSFESKVYILTSKEGGRKQPFYSNYKPQFFFRTTNVTGTIVLPEEVTVVMPGDSLIFLVYLVSACPLNVGLRFVMREGNLTLGAGVVTKVF